MIKSECNARRLSFQRLAGRAVVAEFGGGIVASDVGALLLDALSAHHVELFPGVHHFELARCPRVYAAIREWCVPEEG